MVSRIREDVGAISVGEEGRAYEKEVHRAEESLYDLCGNRNREINVFLLERRNPSNCVYVGDGLETFLKVQKIRTFFPKKCGIMVAWNSSHRVHVLLNSRSR